MSAVCGAKRSMGYLTMYCCGDACEILIKLILAPEAEDRSKMRSLDFY